MIQPLRIKRHQFSFVDKWLRNVFAFHLLFLISSLAFTNSGEAGSSPHSVPTTAGSHDDPYLICEKGKRQSPINISRTNLHKIEDDLIFRYVPTTIHVVHNGHSVQAINEAPGMVLYKGVAYQLLQLHFHEPSEHHIDGTAYMMEMHLVHKNSQGQILVVGVLIQLGTENQEILRAGDWIRQNLGHRAVEEGEEASGAFRLDVMKLLPPNPNHYFTY